MFNAIGVLSTVGDIMSMVWGYLEFHGDIIITVGGILSIAGNTQYRGRYHEYRGGVQYHRGYNLLLFEYSHSTEHHTVLIISPTCIMISLTGLKLQKMISVTVLNTPTVLMISPYSHHDISHGTEYPPQYSRNPPTYS